MKSVVSERRVTARRHGRMAAVATLAGLWLALSAAPAAAYIDPGTGGMLLQLLLGGFAGMAVIGRLYWHRIRAATQRIFGGGDRGDKGTAGTE